MRHCLHRTLALTLQLLLVKGLHGVPSKLLRDADVEVNPDLLKVSLSPTGDVSSYDLESQAKTHDGTRTERHKGYAKIYSLLHDDQMSVSAEGDATPNMAAPTDEKVKEMAVRCSHRKAVLAQMQDPHAAATLPDHGTTEIDDPCAELQKKTTATILKHHIAVIDPKTGERVQIPDTDVTKSKAQIEGEEKLDERASFWWWWSMITGVIFFFAACITCGICWTRFSAERKAKKVRKTAKDAEFKQEYEEAVDRMKKMESTKEQKAAASAARASATGSRTLPPEPGAPPARFDGGRTLPPDPGAPPKRFDGGRATADTGRGTIGTTAPAAAEGDSSEPDF